MRHLTLTVTLLFSVTLIGCGDNSRPSDLPKLYPCTITITQSGKALDGAMVSLIPPEGNAKYRAAASTLADGTAVMHTYGFDGVPAGKFKVVVEKNIEGDIVEKKDAEGTVVQREGNLYRTVEEKYSDAAATPLEIEISGKTESAFDVGNPIRVLVGPLM